MKPPLPLAGEGGGEGVRNIQVDQKSQTAPIRNTMCAFVRIDPHPNPLPLTGEGTKAPVAATLANALYQGKRE
jgi:hypothetical protein